MSQQGYVQRYDWITGNNYDVQPTHPDPNVKLRFNWNAAINIDPFDNNTVYFGSQFVHKSTDKGETWKVISPDLTTNDPEKQKQSESGGLTMDATGAENHTTILVIEPSPIEKDMLWVGTDDGRVHFTQNGGETWTDVSKNIKGLPTGSWIPQIKASNKNKGEALLVANDYRRFNYTPYVYRTKNYGKTWTRIVDETDVKSYALSIIEDLVEPNLLFLGTDDGLYISIDAGSNWTKWTNGFPTVSVKDLVIHPREHDLVIGTFGRAAWVLDDIRPLRAIAKNKNIIKHKLELFNPPTAYKAVYQQPTGSRFGADAMFNGENRGYGAQISYYLGLEDKKDDAIKDDKNKEEEEEEDKNSEVAETKVKWDSVYMKIYDGNKLIRTLKQKAPQKSGMYKWTWYLDEKGPDRPSRSQRLRHDEPGGVSVKPGTYKVLMSFGDQTSEKLITVKDDPRIKVSSQNTNEVYATLKQLEAMQQVAADAVKQLVDSKTIAEEYSKTLAKLDKKANKENIKASKDMTKKIEEIISMYLGRIDERQGITRNPEVTVMQRLGQARRYVSSRQNGITPTETTLIQHAKDELSAALDKTNSFFANEWNLYKSKMQALNLSPFKATKTFKMN
jgi:hypothetical protein